MKKITTLILSLFLLTNLFAQTTHTVYASSYEYSPKDLTIEVGDSVVWINDEGYHDVNGNINSITGDPFNNPETFDSDPTSVAGAVIYAHKFTVAGTYNYDCSVGSHAANGMVGTIVVNPSSPSSSFEIYSDDFSNPSNWVTDHDANDCSLDWQIGNISCAGFYPISDIESVSYTHLTLPTIE